MSNHRCDPESLRLNGDWDIVERPLEDGFEAAERVSEMDAAFSGRVPGDVSDALVRSGRMPEPLEAMNFRKFTWVQERSWWYRRSFAVSEDWRDGHAVDLSLDALDVHADVWLNGAHLGRQISAFYPFVREVKKHLVYDRDNVLLVRLTTGIERTPDDPDFPLLDAVPTEANRDYPDRGMQKRIYLRKPAYVWGWDWGPCLPTCGITGNVELHCRGETEIRDVALSTRLDGKDAVVDAAIELEHNTLTDSAWAAVTLTFTDEDGNAFTARKDNVFTAAGITTVDMSLVIPEARLWWPNGSGNQHCYTVTVSADINGQRIEKEPFLHGVRTVELENRPGRFAFRINGQALFIKGGNWIPCDALYGRITDEKVTRLVEEAAEANFNCLRIWGGGRFEVDAFYDACDRLGIMVWQDFMSACAPLPGHEEWFVSEFRREAEYQVRRLRSRACILLWCGNNEVGGCYHWFPEKFSEHRDPGWHLYHELLPRLTHDMSPRVPYWPTSPYGGRDGVGDPVTGDDHHWVVMSPDEEFWSCPEYWDSPELPIFNSEYGYGGPCCIESTREYMGTDTPDLFDETGREHTNTFYDIPRVNFSITEHYRDAEGLDLDTYILLGGLCQGLNLGYSLESLRANGHTMGGIFWMYNDTWGENGWSIIDYYLRRKISYYNVKRCLAPQRLVLRRGGQAFGGEADEVVLVAVNDGPRRLRGTLHFGYLSYDGETRELKPIEYAIEPYSNGSIASCPAPDADHLQNGTVVALPDGDDRFEPASWRHCRFRETGSSSASVRVERADPDGGDLLVTVRSDTFAHAVHFNIDGSLRLSDNYFDLLPGQEKTVRIYGAVELDPEALAAVSVGALPPTDTDQRPVFA